MSEGELKASTNVLLSAAALVVVVAGMKLAQPIIVPFLLSVFIAVISAPPLLWLEEHRLPRPVAMLIVIVGIIAVVFGLTAVVGPSIGAFTGDIPEYQARLNAQLDILLVWLGDMGVNVAPGSVS